MYITVYSRWNHEIITRRREKVSETQIKKIKKWKQAEEKQMQRNNYYVSY
jgi:hypothetical protein